MYMKWLKIFRMPDNFLVKAIVDLLIIQSNIYIRPNERMRSGLHAICTSSSFPIGSKWHNKVWVYLYIQRRLRLPNNENNTESKLPAQSWRDLLGATGPTPAGGVVLLSLLAVPLLVLLIGSILLLLLLLLLLRPVTLLVSPGLLLTSCLLLPSSLSIVPLLKYINICVKVINNWCMQLLKLIL